MPISNDSLIVKSSSGKPKIREFFTVNFEQEAENILKEARAQAKRDAGKIERIAYEQGFEKGEKAGMELGIQQLTPYLDQFRNIILELSYAREIMLKNMEPQIVELALDISKKIVKQVVENDKETAARIAKEAISQLTGNHSIVIYVSKSDYDLMTELMPQFKSMDQVKDCTIEVDLNVEPGGCILETENETVDARISIGLEETEQLLEELPV